MLVLNRKRGEQIQIGEDITLTVLEIRKSVIRLGVSAPRHVPIGGSELLSGNDREVLNDHSNVDRG